MLVSGIGYLKYLPSNGGILSSSYSSSESEMVVSGDGSRTSLQSRLRVILGHILSHGMLRCEWFIAGGFSCLNIVFWPPGGEWLCEDCKGHSLLIG